MRKAIVTYFMCEENSGAFVTGVLCSGEYTQDEINQGKPKELIKGVILIEGGFWSQSIDWIETSKPM